MRRLLPLLLLVGCAAVADLYNADGDRECDPRSIFYEDVDGDGAGNPASVYVGCAVPAGYVATGEDCDDLEPDFSTECGSADSGG